MSQTKFVFTSKGKVLDFSDRIIVPSGFLPVNARLPVNAHLMFICQRSRTSVPLSPQNGRSLVFPVFRKMADKRDKLKYDTFCEILHSTLKLLIKVHVIWQFGHRIL